MSITTDRNDIANAQGSYIEPHPREVQDAQATQDSGPSSGPWGDTKSELIVGWASSSLKVSTTTAITAGSEQTVEERAKRAVTLTDNGRGIILTAPGTASVTLEAHPNPTLAKQRVADIRRFAAALIRSGDPARPARGTSSPSPWATEGPADGGYPADADLHQMTDDGGPLVPDPARWSDPVWKDDPESTAGGKPLRGETGPHAP